MIKYTYIDNIKLKVIFVRSITEISLDREIVIRTI